MKVYKSTNKAINKLTGKTLIIKILTLIVVTVMLLQGCSSQKLKGDADPSQGAQPDKSMMQQEDSLASDQTKDIQQNNEQGADNSDTADDHSDTGDENDQVQTGPQAIDLNEVKPNEAGRIMVVMFHNFIEKYEKGDKAYTTTFDEFEKLLHTLYDSDYRLISMKDYLTGNIDVPAGCIPMVFTFDDGTAGQFNLIEENGKLIANPDSAVGIMEKFNKTHPDFGLRGTFFVNLGNQTFGSTGTLEQRLEYLIDKGFEIGNHTYSHINLKTEAKTAAIIQKEIGENQKKMYELIPGYTFVAFSLPYGAPSKELSQYVIKGEYEGTVYENPAIMEVGWDPAPSPFSVKYNPLSTHRVRSSGIEPVDQDLGWWLTNMKRDNQYVSDGDPATVTIPESYLEYVNQEMLGGRTLRTY